VNGDEHRTLREQLGAYALGQLDADARVAVRAHLDGCPACRAELAEIAPLADLLRRVDPDRLTDQAAPPAHLGEQVVRRVRAQDADRDSRQRQPASRRRAWALAAAAALVAGIVGIGVGALLDGGDEPGDVPLEPVVVSELVEGVDASAELIAHTWGTEIQLEAEGLVDGASYQAVISRADGTQVPAGTFIGTGADRMRCNLNAALLRDQATGFTVTASDGQAVITSTFD
jgi:hypothetical protein